MFAQSKGGNYSLTNGASDVADAIDFDGATNYLSRSSDLVGNADGKTFTFSCWVHRSSATAEYLQIYGNDSPIRFNISADDNQFLIIARNSSGNNILYIDGSAGKLPRDTFMHVLVSVDLTNASKRNFYVNDQDITSSVSWSIYTNTNINFTGTLNKVGYWNNNGRGRLAHLYLDYTYRDLSVTANRRLFITADRKPAANQAALNPILYLPLNDPTQPGKNLGTGGDFALNGVVARSGRGPNQFNAAYSDLDGSTQYLSRTTKITGIADGKQFTVSFSVNSDDGIDFAVMSFSTNSNQMFYVRWSNGTNINILGYNSSGTAILRVESQIVNLVPGRNYTVVCSCDLNDVNKRHISVNGANLSATWFSYTNDNIAFNLSTTPLYAIGSFANLAGKPNGKLGNIFFDTKYIDLSQPANLAKFVTGTGIDAKPADLGANGEKPFGTAPLIYLPMYGNNAGKNYGTGGDFTVNSGPYTGARGPNEFWGNRADFSGGYLERSATPVGISDSKTVSGSFFFSPDQSTERPILDVFTGSTSSLSIRFAQAVGRTIYVFRNSAGIIVLSGYSSGTTLNIGTTHSVQFCFDTADTGKRFVYVDGVQQSITWTTYTNDTIEMNASATWWIGRNPNPSYLDGKLSEFYFTTEYIDFSQEANRLKFRDAFGNPVDLRPQIAAGTLPNPAIYMRFDPANFGKNEGTGGDFVVNGTITDGGQL